MMTVQEFTLPASAGAFSLTMPAGAQFLSAQTKLALLGGVAGGRLYALVDTTASSESRNFVLRANGTEVPTSGSEQYLATFQAGLGLSVFHLFEVYE